MPPSLNPSRSLLATKLSITQQNGSQLRNRECISKRNVEKPVSSLHLVDERCALLEAAQIVEELSHQSHGLIGVSAAGVRSDKLSLKAGKLMKPGYFRSFDTGSSLTCFSTAMLGSFRPISYQGH